MKESARALLALAMSHKKAQTPKSLRFKKGINLIA